MKQIPEPSAGILLHISSLPSPYGIGNLGESAYRFIDFLVQAGQRYWQVLPVEPTGYGDSPYQAFSAFAGNPYFIDLDQLREDGLLTEDQCATALHPPVDGPVDYGWLYDTRIPLLQLAFDRFSTHGARQEDFAAFCMEQESWLADYALFMALKYHFNQQRWLDWPEDIRLHQADAVAHYRADLSWQVQFWQFVQYLFFTQWDALHAYAKAQGIAIIGDMPLYVAPDSADTWSHRENFLLFQDGSPYVVAGVPPDYFSQTGQLWGNCLYNWDAMAADGFSWWKQRIRSAAGLFDVVRIDHFCGVQRYWAIPADEDTAVNGKYEPGPGMALIHALDEARGETGIIAEDLGLITPEIRQLIADSGYPGMRVAQFGFGGDDSNEHLAQNYPAHCVAYTGTHDNNTTGGFLAEADAHILEDMARRMGLEEGTLQPEDLVAYTMASPARLVIVPMQDHLGLDGQARMNTPSTLGGNWLWRVSPAALTPDLAQDICLLTEASGRISAK